MHLVNLWVLWTSTYLLYTATQAQKHLASKSARFHDTDHTLFYLSNALLGWIGAARMELDCPLGDALWQMTAEVYILIWKPAKNGRNSTTVVFLYIHHDYCYLLSS